MRAYLDLRRLPRTSLIVAAVILLVGLVVLRTVLDGANADAAAVSPPFAILSDPVPAGDAANSPILAAAKDDPTLQTDRARRVGRVTIGSLWLVPTSDDRTCLAVEPDPSTVGPVTAVVDGHKVTTGPPPNLTYNCVSNDVAASGGLLTGLRGRLAGYTPDGVTSVSAVEADGSQHAVDAQPHVYAVPPKAVGVVVNGSMQQFGFTTIG